MGNRIKFRVAVIAAFVLSAAMAWSDTSTNRLSLTKPTIGTSGWGTKWNTNADTIDTGVAVLATTNTFTQPQYFPDGTMALPGIAMSSQHSMGWLYGGANIFSSAVNGVHVASFTSTGAYLRANDGVTRPTTGYAGHYVEHVIPTPVNFPAATNVWTQASTITLTAGNWLITFMVIDSEAAGSQTSQFQIGISTVTGNNTTTLIFGSNAARSPLLTANDGTTISVPSYYFQTTATVEVYGKLLGTYTVNPPTYRSRLSAIRVP